MQEYRVNYRLRDAQNRVFKSGTLKVEASSPDDAKREAQRHFYNNGSVDHLAQVDVQVVGSSSGDPDSRDNR